MKNKNKILFRLMIGLMVVGLVGVNLLAVVHASPPAQDPRPPAETGGDGGDGDGDGGGGGGDGTGNAAEEAGPVVPGCAATTGQVVNWGLGPQADIGVELKTGSWRTATRSASDGNYGLGGLGVGIAKLHVGLAPGQAKQLQPLIQDAGVYLNCTYPTVANIAVFSGPRVDPPAKIEMAAPSQTIAPDSNFEITLTIENDLPTDITNVIVTDLMPQGFKALKVNSSVDPTYAQIVDGGEDGQLVVLNWDKLASRAKATIRLTVNADVDLLGGTKIRNAATLFYRESAADQAWLDFTVGSDETPVLAASGAAGSEGADFIPPAEAPTTGGSLLEPAADSAQPAAAGQLAASTANTTAPGDEFVPPSNMPSTGGEIDLPVDTLDPMGEVNLARAELVVGHEVNRANEGPARPSGLAITTEHSEQSEMVVVHNAASRGPSITVAVAVLFLGLLVLGSGLTFWRRRFDS